jgi:hypothetical protein
MSETVVTESAPPEKDSGASSFEPITSQEALDKVISARLARATAKYADYDDVKSKAAKLDDIEAANKSELQKANERAEAAERKAAETESKALRATVAAAKGVPASSITGTTKEELEASADELIAWREKNSPPAKRKPPASSMKSGATGSGDNLTGKERAAAALRQMRAGA